MPFSGTSVTISGSSIRIRGRSREDRLRFHCRGSTRIDIGCRISRWILTLAAGTRSNGMPRKFYVATTNNCGGVANGLGAIDLASTGQDDHIMEKHRRR
jgi:hypothetical protein